ncbi:hypothetical protein Droror1_Dr00026666 [Drosera rotundifolia]
MPSAAVAAAPTRTAVLSLLRSLLRASRAFADYNIREYAIRRSLDGFRHNAAVSDPAEVEKLFQEGRAQFEVVRRQGLVYELYAPKIFDIRDHGAVL